MYAHLVETSEEESSLAITRYVSTLLGDGETRTALAETPASRFLEEGEALLADGDFGALVERLLAHADLIFSKASDKDLECCLALLVHLVPRVAPDAAEGVVAKLTDTFASRTEDHPELRLQSLAQLYNVVQDEALQYAVLMRVIAYAQASKLPNAVAPVVKGKVEGWVKEWKLALPQQRALYLACIELLQAAKKKSLAREANRLSLRALTLFEDATGPELEAAGKVALAQVRDFLANPEVLQFDLLAARPVAALEGAPGEGGRLHELLTLVLRGDVKGVEAFAAEHAAVLEGAGLRGEELLGKARLAALLALCRGSRSLPFRAIQDALGIEAGEVEGWIIRGVGRKLLEARIDQVQQTVSVSRAALTAFSEPMWAELQAQIKAWKASLETLNSALAPAAGLANGHGVPPMPIQV